MSHSNYNKISTENLEKATMGEHSAHFKGRLLWLCRTARPNILLS